MTKTYADYEKEIVSLNHVEHRSDAQNKRLHDCVKLWADRLTMVVHRSGQENDPYTEDELGCDIVRMELKADTGIKQVGDYLFFLPEYNIFTGVMWERKAIGASGGHDMYQTMVHDRDRFIREIDAYLHRQEFDIMIVGVESTEMEYLAHRPNGMKGASRESRHALWKHLEVRFGYRVRVDWLGSRALCCRMLVEENRIWIKVNYKEVLGL